MKFVCGDKTPKVVTFSDLLPDECFIQDRGDTVVYRMLQADDGVRSVLDPIIYHHKGADDA